MTEIQGRPPLPGKTAQVRVRIAPSPTGDPHVGTAYIALFNYALATRYNGVFVLRIEDTDQERCSPRSERDILEALRWLGLCWDEGPDCGGLYGPYRQSERLPVYQNHVQKLVAAGHAYPCFCSKERLESLRTAQEGESLQGYDGHCRDLDPQVAAARIAEDEPHVLRFRSPRDQGETRFMDHLRGEQCWKHKQIDDFVLLKSDRFPTYHLANVVDDHLMRISHVLRGEEWLASTAKHVLLYKAFGWDPPEFFHLGLLRNADKSKLSKRKNPVSILHYKELGYLPHTLLEYLATLGYSDPQGRDRVDRFEMRKNFDWTRMSPGGPVFDGTKLDAWGCEDLRALNSAEVVERLTALLEDGPLRRLVGRAAERVPRLGDILPYIVFAFGGVLDYPDHLLENSLPSGRSPEEVASTLEKFADTCQDFTDPGKLENFARTFCQDHGWKTKDLFTLLRVAVTARRSTPGLFEVMAACGKSRVRLRLRDVATKIRQEKP